MGLSESASGSGSEVTLYIEGINRSDYAAGTIKLMIDPDGAGPVGFISTDIVRLTVGGGELDIDSANSSDSEYDTDDAGYEEYIEDLAGLPGKIILVNDGDNDSDGKPNFADGFSGSPGVSDDERGDTFAQMKFQLPNWVDFSQAKFTFIYDASDPAEVGGSVGKYAPGGDGHLRIWKAYDGDDWLAAPVNASGHYVASGEAYTAAQLGYDAGVIGAAGLVFNGE